MFFYIWQLDHCNDGKIIKPEGWKAPNINKEIERQIKEGSFN